MRLLLIIVVVVLSALGYGYWHSSTHASFYVTLNVQGQADREPTSMPRVEFLDSKGVVLANGVQDAQYNFLHLIHPVHGDCHEVEKIAAFSEEAKTSWQECFEHQSLWIAEWIRDVNKVNVAYDRCLIRNHSIAVSNPSSDWYLWWVPHPHIGGTPYSNYSATINVDEKDCR